MGANECDRVLLVHNLVFITLRMVMCLRFMFNEVSFENRTCRFDFVEAQTGPHVTTFLR